MNPDQLRQTVMGAPQQTTPTTAYPELQKYYDINFQLPLSNAGVRALSGQVEAKNTQSEYDIKRKAESLQNKGKNYTRTPKQDGGFAFYDDVGNEVSAHQYARATGKNTYEVLNDSENPIDIQYLRDYSNLQDFLDASLSGDKEAISAYYAENPSLKNLSPGDVLKKFQAAYPTVYGLKQPGQRLGSTFIPNLSSLRGGGGFSDFDEG